MLDAGLFQGLISQLDLSLRTCKSRTLGLFRLNHPGSIRTSDAEPLDVVSKPPCFVDITSNAC